MKITQYSLSFGAILSNYASCWADREGITGEKMAAAVARLQLLHCSYPPAMTPKKLCLPPLSFQFISTNKKNLFMWSNSRIHKFSTTVPPNCSVSGQNPTEDQVVHSFFLYCRVLLLAVVIC